MELRELAGLLREAYHNAPHLEKAVRVHLFGIKYAAELTGRSIPTIVKLADLPKNWESEIRKGIALAKYVELKNRRVAR